MKISIIMPTYNDSKTIIETFNSVINQTYQWWELIIIDDGSTDNTKKIKNDYKQNIDKKNQLKYYYQENNDQLNAVVKGIEYVTGDYIFILHSDDLLPNNDFFFFFVNYINRNESYDAYIGDLLIIDEGSNIIGRQRVTSYKKSNIIFPLQLLWLGRNLYVDVAFYKKDVFINAVKNNYLTWNMPFWLSTDSDFSLLNVKNVNFPMLKYRVHSDNYINNEIGKLNVINGELRTITRLLKCYYIPFYNIQHFIYRVFNKLKLNKYYIPIFLKKETFNKHKIIKIVIKKRFGRGYIKYTFFNNLIAFYQNYNNRSIIIKENLNNEYIYEGKDIRKFNQLLLENKLSPFYNRILNEMGIGFNEIVVKDEAAREKVLTVIKFLCLYPYVKISIENEIEV